MRANIRGGGGDSGKCTIEVEVDGVAEVEVRGDTGRIRTLQGQPSNWRRLDCNSQMPRNPGDFRFKGIDGRGRVQLIRDPNSNGGTAVVRIEDSKGGREGYTFDLEWRGGSDLGLDRDRDRLGLDPDRDRLGLDPDRDRLGRDRDRRRDDRLSPGRGGRYADSREALDACQDAVRVRARREYNVRDLSFRSTNVDDLPGNRDRVVGTFEDNRRDQYDYSCTINVNNGSIRSVDIRRR